MHINFYAVSYNGTHDLIVLKILEKLQLQRPHKAMPAKIIPISSFKVCILYAKFCMILGNKIRDKIITIFGKNGIAAPPIELYVP